MAVKKNTPKKSGIKSNEKLHSVTALKSQTPRQKTPNTGYLIVTLIIIAILTASFMFALADAFLQQPQSRDCYPAPKISPNGTAMPQDTAQSQQCYTEYEIAQKAYASNRFFITSGVSLIAIIVILLFFTAYGGIAWFINTGIVLGSLFAIMLSTLNTYSSLAQPIRPFVLLIEIAIVIWVAYKRFGK